MTTLVKVKWFYLSHNLNLSTLAFASPLLFTLCSVVLFYIISVYISLFSCHFIVNLWNTIPWICGVFDEETRGGWLQIKRDPLPRCCLGFNYASMQQSLRVESTHLIPPIMHTSAIDILRVRAPLVNTLAATIRDSSVSLLAKLRHKRVAIKLLD
jgi:hypothetical protein